MAHNAGIRSGLSWLAVFRVFDSDWAVSVLFVFFAAAMTALLFGFLSRAAMLAVFVWLHASSLQIAPAYTGWDAVLRSVGLVLLLSPLGQIWSVDACLLRRAGRLPSTTAPVYGLYLVQWQIAVMYFVTAALKLSDTYWQSGEFAAYFYMSMFSLFPNPIYAQWQTVSLLLSYFALAAELSLPLLLWCKRTRLLGFVVGGALHVSIAATSIIWVFSVVVLALYPAYLDDEEVQRLAAWAKSRFGRS